MFEQMKGLSPKKKIEYFFQYYGLISLIAIVIIVAVITFVVGRVTAKTSVAGIMVVNDNGEVNTMQEELLSDILVSCDIDPKENVIEVNDGIYVGDGSNPNMEVAYVQKMVALISARCIDVIFSDEGYFTTIEEDETCADLSDYIDEAVLEAHKEDLIYYTEKDTGKEIVAGIRVSRDNELLKELNWYDEDPVVTIVYGTENPEVASQIVNAFLD